jgi:hypothetical protein
MEEMKWYFVFMAVAAVAYFANESYEKHETTACVSAFAQTTKTVDEISKLCTAAKK